MASGDPRALPSSFPSLPLGERDVTQLAAHADGQVRGVCSAVPVAHRRAQFCVLRRMRFSQPTQLIPQWQLSPQTQRSLVPVNPRWSARRFVLCAHGAGRGRAPRVPGGRREPSAPCRRAGEAALPVRPHQRSQSDRGELRGDGSLRGTVSSAARDKHDPGAGQATRTGRVTL